MELNANEIVQYLAELGAVLKIEGINKPIRILLIGGAYMMLLTHAPRTTGDVDYFWLEEDLFQQTVVQQPFAIFMACLQAIANKYALEPRWLNNDSQILLLYDIIAPVGKLWKCFGSLHIYAPSEEYILALKIIAGRDKDITDSAILLPRTKIKTREQAQQLLDRYILPEAQKMHAEQIEVSLSELFKEKR